MDSVTETMLLMGKQMEQYHALVMQLHKAELDARAKRADATVAESSVFLRTEGTVDTRKHTAKADDKVVELSLAADVAEVTVNHLKRCIAGCQTQIDVYRSQGSWQKAELSTLGSKPQDWT